MVSSQGGIFRVKISIVIYFQSECIEKYQFELCSKYDTEHDLTSYSDTSYFVAS